MDSNQGQTAKKYLPALVLFIIGTIAGYFIMGMEGSDVVFSTRVIISILIGWGLGGSAYGWLIVRKWFPPKVYINTGMDVNAFLRTAGLVGKIFLSVIVGTFALPVGIIILLTTLFRRKKTQDDGLSG